MVKKIIRVLGIMLAIFCLLVVGFIGLLIYDSEYAVRPVDTSVSPDGAYTLYFDQIGSPDWPFGSVKARLTLKMGRRTAAKHNTSLADDGANVNPIHWRVEWHEDSVEIVLDASEQEPEHVSFKLH